jgi:hypothetical protein
MSRLVLKILRLILWIVIILWVIVTAVGYISGCASLWAPASHTPALRESGNVVSVVPPVTSTSIDTLVRQVLTNMHLHAWNAQAMTHGVKTGGLFLNWNMADPALVNMIGPGQEDLKAHDPQVDLLYLTALTEYRQLHPSEQSYTGDLQRALVLVENDFRNYSVPKGWLYFDLLADGLALRQSLLLQEARTLAGHLYDTWYDPQVGNIYDRKHAPPDYNTAHSLESGAALIDAGRRWEKPAWVAAGQRTLQHLMIAAFDRHYQLFDDSMLAAPDGEDRVESSELRAASEGEAVGALVLAYQLTGGREYLERADEVLQSLFSSSGLWDRQRGGFYFALHLRNGAIITDYKETRAQCLTLLSIHRYNQVASQERLPEERALLALLSGPFYEHNYHGFFYRVSADFKIYSSKPGAGIGFEDYFTTEAMGCALTALQQTLLPALPAIQP